MLLYRLHNLKLYDFYDVTNIFMGRALRGRASLGGRVPGAGEVDQSKTQGGLTATGTGGQGATTKTLDQ